MLKSLIGIRLRAVFLGIAKTKNGKKTGSGRIVGLALLYAFLALCFGTMSFIYGMGIGEICLMNGLDWLFFTLFAAISFTIVFVFSIFETKSELFDCKDNDLLLSLPIPAGKIVLARILTVLIFNYAEMALFFFPATLAFVLADGRPTVLLGAFILWLFLPLVATALSAAVGYAVAVISRKTKNKTFVTMIFSLGFLGLYLWGYTSFIGNMDSIVDGSFDMQGLAKNLSFARFIGDAVFLKPLPLLEVVAICSAVAFMAYKLISRSYFRIATDRSGAKKSVYHAAASEKKSAFSALVAKEFRRFTSSAAYMLNAGFGLVFDVALAVVVLIKSKTLKETLALLSEEFEFPILLNGDVLPAALTGALLLLAMMTFISATSVSLEGKSLWLIRSLPVTARQVLLAKMMPHLILTEVTTLICGSLLSIAVGAEWYWFLLMILVPGIGNVFAAAFGICINVAFPKFDFENETQVVKQSASSAVCCLGGMLFGMMLLVGIIGLSVLLGGVFAVVTVGLLLSLLAAVCLVLVFGPCAKKFDTL